jgi:hypothetical protein
LLVVERSKADSAEGLGTIQNVMRVFRASPIVDKMGRTDAFCKVVRGPSGMVLVGKEYVTLGRKMEK